MDTRVERIVSAISASGPAVATARSKDGKTYVRLSRAHGGVFAYIYPQRGRLKIVTSQRLAESIHFTRWDREGNDWFGAQPSVELRVEDDIVEQEANAIRTLKQLAST